MKEFIFLIITILGNIATCVAQEGYKVSGKIEGLANGSLLLISDEQGKPDTLGNVRTINGTFEFTGKVTAPLLAYITTADQKEMIPLILENAIFTVSMESTGIIVKGGTQQDILNQFTRINTNLLQDQEKMKGEFKVAQQAKNTVMMQVLEQQFNNLIKSAQARERELLEKYADSYVAAYVVASSMQKLDLELLKLRYRDLGNAAKTTIPGRSVAALIAEQEKVAEGEVAPDFTIKNPDGGIITLKDVGGKVKLIDFWASWCAPCRQENLNLLRIYQKYHSKGLVIISISLDESKQAWTKAITEDGMIWENGSDLKGEASEIARQYCVRGIPHTLLLDEQNRIIAKDLRGKALQQKIAELLKGK